MVAPHPDDESLACSVVIQRAVRAGASIRVIYATDGDNNPWPQRASDCKWRLSQLDRARWGQRRRQETLAALEALDVSESHVHFLGLPDQGLTNLLLSGCAQTVNRFTQCITDWAPTDMFWPDISDIHPDHSALAVMLRLVSETLPLNRFRQPLVWNFLVHGDRAEFFRRAVMIRPTTGETLAKLTAINCHNTQLRLSRRRFTAYAEREEFFAPYQLDSSARRTALTPVRDHLVFGLRPRRRRLFYRSPRVLVVGCDPVGELRSVCLPVDGHGCVSKMLDPASDECIDTISSEGTLFSGLRIALPTALFAADRGIYLKVERRGIFFDEAGWADAAEVADDYPATEAEFEGELTPALG